MLRTGQPYVGREAPARFDRHGDGTLADAAQWSPFHLHRVFKRVTGLTPKAYAAAHRGKRANGGSRR